MSGAVLGVREMRGSETVLESENASLAKGLLCPAGKNGFSETGLGPSPLLLGFWDSHQEEIHHILNFQEKGSKSPKQNSTVDLIKQTQQEDTGVGWMKGSLQAAHLLGDVGSLLTGAEFWGFSKDL